MMGSGTGSGPGYFHQRDGVFFPDSSVFGPDFRVNDHPRSINGG